MAKAEVAVLSTIEQMAPAARQQHLAVTAEGGLRGIEPLVEHVAVYRMVIIRRLRCQSTWARPPRAGSHAAPCRARRHHRRAATYRDARPARAREVDRE